ncbi:S-layer family protein [Ureibacillus xyleni]|uniref:S-layer family protein n=1 Tax=Ureibacillus xyleni TaxID=614648 RepID=A0A285T5L5_9BACL|nr:S-layer homology domain-containing protein [Ureibacillus xyleni]SOC16672.1 S-layer family protein [Ureibacillus xyleni]
MNKFNKLLVISAITGSLLFTSSLASAASFKDLGNDYWAQHEIEYLVDQQIIKGYPDGTFLPGKSITKAQAAVMLVRALNLSTKNSKITFKDVPKSHSSYKEIAAVVEAGIFPTSKEFKPNAPMTRELMAEVLVNAFKLEGAGTKEFKDVPKTSKSYKAISILAENDITTGSADGTFKPAAKVTRDQFSVFMARALNPDFLPNQYNIPMNVNPVSKLFDYVLKNPEGVPSLLDLKVNIDFLSLSKAIKEIELVEMKEVARLKGVTEFSVKLNVSLNDVKQDFLKEGENKLFFLVSKKGYMDFKIVSVGKTPHLKEDDSVVTSKEAIALISGANKAYWYAVSGGEGPRELETFMKGDLEYRYMGETLDSEEKLLNYLGTWYSPEQTAKLFKELGFITHNGKLAQPNADGGSLLNWEKATAKLIKSSTKSKTFEVKVPIADFGEYETNQVDLRFVEGIGWRVNKLAR